MIDKILTFSSRNSIVGIMLVLFFSAIAIVGLQKLKIDTSYDSFLDPNDPGYPVYNKTINEFGSDAISIIYIKDPSIFTADKLIQIEDLVYSLEEIPGVEKVESIFSVLNIRDRDGILSAEPLMDTTPDDIEEINHIREDALYSPLINSNFVSKDSKVVAVNVITNNTDNNPDFNKNIFNNINGLITPLSGNFEDIFQIGPPRLNVDIENSMIDDMQFITPLSIFILVTAIFFFLHTLLAASTPLVTAGISVLWSYGFMGFMGIPLNLLTAILPSLVIVIGSTEDTHMLASYLHGIKENDGNESIRSIRKNAIRFMSRHVGLPIFLTSFTTVIGFFSNSISSITLIHDFALATSFAMFANLVSTVLLLPLLLLYFGPTSSKISAHDKQGESVIAKTTSYIHDLIENRANKIAIITIIIVGTLAVQATNINVSNDPLSYFKSDHKIISDSDKLHNDLSGMQIFYLTIEAPPGKDFKDPELLSQVNDIEKYINKQGSYDKVISIASHLSLVNQEMNNGDHSYYTTPKSRELIEQYLILFQRSDIERYINSNSNRINIVVRHNMSDSSVLNKEINKLENKISSTLDNNTAYYFTGKNLMINRSAEELFSGQVTSLALLTAVVFVIMSLLYTSITAGFISLIPNLIPVAVMFGVMGTLGIPLNPGTATVAVIAVGIAVDDTIHILSRYNDEYKKTTSQSEALKNTLWAESIPVISTSIALAVGFGVLFISNFNIVAQFGMLSALTIICAMLTDLLITPILLKKVRLISLWDIISLKVGKDVLLNSTLLNGLTKFQIKKAILLSDMIVFQKGDIIVQQGETGDEMYLILDGNVNITHEKDGNNELVATLNQGDVFGEIGYLKAYQRTATVTAIDEVTVLAFNNHKVETNMRIYPRISSRINLNVSRIIGQRFGETASRI